MSARPTIIPPLVEEEDTLDNRRRRGEVACAECRRLKIKCDKIVPCGSCVRRNCADLCPNGTNTTAEGTRVVLDATVHLHEHIATIRERIRELQGALAEVQRGHSTEPHPLLAATAESSSDEEEEGLESVSALTRTIDDLALADDGSVVFFGTAPTPLAAPAPIATPSSTIAAQTINFQPLHPELLRCIRQFPFPLGGRPVSDIIATLKSYLPSYDTAYALVQDYFTTFSVMFNGISRELVDEVLVSAYHKPSSPEGSHATRLGETSSHPLALLFTVLSMGSYVRFPPSERMAIINYYAQLSLAALGTVPIIDRPTVISVQATYMNSWSSIILQAGDEETARARLALACQLCYSLGLHRDPARWALPAHIGEHRVAVFWMVYNGDMWESLSSGRAPRLATAAIDCPPPDGFFMGSLLTEGRFIIAEVIDCTVSKEPPSYAHVLDLDGRMRQLGTVADDPTRFPVLSVLLVYLHRAFFALAVKESPSDPMNSIYRTSFEATVRSVRAVMDWLVGCYRHVPDIALTFAYEWATGVTAAIVYASLVTSARSSQREAALTVLGKMDELVEVYESASTRGSGRATHALPTMRSLRDRARHHIEQQSAPAPEHSGHDQGMPWALDELLGKGSPRRVSPSAESSPGASRPQSTSQAVTSSLGNNHERGSTAAYPAYLQRSRRLSPSSQAAETVPTPIQAPEPPFVAYPYGAELSAEQLLAGPSSLRGQWDAHVRRESVFQ